VIVDAYHRADALPPSLLSTQVSFPNGGRVLYPPSCLASRPHPVRTSGGPEKKMAFLLDDFEKRGHPTAASQDLDYISLSKGAAILLAADRSGTTRVPCAPRRPRSKILRIASYSAILDAVNL